MAHAGFCRGVGIRGCAEPGAFVNQSFQAAGPLAPEFVDISARIWSTTITTISLGREARRGAFAGVVAGAGFGVCVQLGTANSSATATAAMNLLRTLRCGLLLDVIAWSPDSSGV